MVCLTMSSVMSAPRTVRDNVMALSQLGNGYSDKKIKGKNATEIFENFLILENGSSDGLVYKEIDKMDYGDEVHAGFTSVNQQQKWPGF